MVRTGESERSLAAGRVYLIGRDPQADIVVTDFRVSWHHAELRPARGRWALADLASSNGSYADGHRADLIEIGGTRQIRLGDPEDGPRLDCTLLTRPAGQARRIGRVPDNDIMLAEAALFNGIRSASQDYIYRDEIARFAAEGVLNHVHVAMSREQPGHREYVQDRIRAQGELVWRLLGAGGYVYVCGAQPMRDAVRTAFADVIAEHGRLPRDRAEAYLDELETTARYRPDLWG